MALVFYTNRILNPAVIAIEVLINIYVSAARLDQARYLRFILPLILMQAAGWRRPIRSSWLIGLPFGGALGVLYSVTTISGPPFAILFNNQGLVKDEFRAGFALVRAVESSVTAFVYYYLGLFVSESAPTVADPGYRHADRHLLGHFRHPTP